MSNHAEEYADTMRESIEEVMTAYRDGEEIEGEEAGDYLAEWPLEIVNRRGTEFRILLTYGGPNAYVTCDLDEGGERTGDAKLEVYWGSDEARRYSSSINEFADYYAELSNP